MAAAEIRINFKPGLSSLKPLRSHIVPSIITCRLHCKKYAIPIF
jgi:hypothetical protein